MRKSACMKEEHKQLISNQKENLSSLIDLVKSPHMRFHLVNEARSKMVANDIYEIDAMNQDCGK